ncbi:MAG TPA: LemA family protein [Pyrinomonadaceae bacterium]|nr:LemA family protein [Pyrinomonadaceae bacterium]
MKTRRLVILFTVVLISFAASGCGYNTLTTKRENVKGKWANTEAQLQRRADLINNLVQAAVMAGIQEQEVFGRIADARSRLLSATSQPPQGEGGDRSPEQKQQIMDAANSLGGTLGRLLVLQEAYPQLRSNENFLKLQDEIAGTENRIATARNDYNAAVQDYNTTRSRFPTVISAKLFGFEEEPYFRAEEGARQAPTIDPNVLRQNQNK